MDLKSLLKKHEGIKLYVYDDATGLPIEKGSIVKGNPTIGIGRLVIEDKGITEEEALFLLDNDIKAVISACRETFSWFAFLDNVRAAVVASMVFNLGLGGFLKFKKTISAISQGDYNKAADEMKDSAWYEQVGTRGVELVEMMRTGRA